MGLDIETDLRAYILADATVAGLIGTRMVPSAEGQGIDRPYVRYMRVSTEVVRALKRNSGLRWARIQLDCFGDSYSSAKAVAHAITARVDPEARGRVDYADTCVQSALVLDEWDEYEEPVKGGEKGIYRTSLDLKVWWEE